MRDQNNRYDFVSHWVNKLVEEIGSWSDVLVRGVRAPDCQSYHFYHLYHSFISEENHSNTQRSNAHSNVTKNSDTNARTQVREHADAMLRDCGLESKLRLISSRSGDAKMSELDGLRPKELHDSMKSLYSKIFSLTMPQFDRVQDSRLRSEARRSMCVLIANAHKTVFDMVTDSKSGYNDPMSIVIHNPFRVRTLLDVD